MPSASGPSLAVGEGVAVDNLAQVDRRAGLVGQLDADHRCPWHHCNPGKCAAMARLMSSASETTQAIRCPGAGTNSNSVTTGPGRANTTSP